MCDHNNIELQERSRDTSRPTHGTDASAHQHPNSGVQMSKTHVTIERAGMTPIHASFEKVTCHKQRRQAGTSIRLGT